MAEVPLHGRLKSTPWQQGRIAQLNWFPIATMTTISEASKIPKQDRTQQPGLHTEMAKQPIIDMVPSGKDGEVLEPYRAAGKLKGRIALITGGDSGIGRSVAVMYALEGADGIAIVYLPREEQDARDTKAMIEKKSQAKVELIQSDIGHEESAAHVVKKVVEKFGRIDILVNNASEQHLVPKIEDLTAEQVERTFRSNIFGMIFVAKHAVKHMGKGSSIINTTSITAFQGSAGLLDYSCTKGAIVTFTRSLSKQLVKRGIRVNAVAPGPIWTPLIPASFESDSIEGFGESYPMGRAGQPSEVAPCYVFLGSADSSYMTAQILHPNGGVPV